MLLVVLQLSVQVAAGQPQHYGYEQPGRSGDHLLPAWPDTATTPGGLYHQLVASILDLPGANAFGGGDTAQTHVWGIRFPSFAPEAGYAITSSWEDDTYRLVGRQAETMIWPDFDDLVGWQVGSATASERYAAAATLAGTAMVETCDVPLDADLAVRLIDEVNARLAKVRAGLVPKNPPPTIYAATDGTIYWFGGVAFGLTRNVPQGSDTALLRGAADAVLDHCFSPDAATRPALEAVVAALEASEPG